MPPENKTRTTGDLFLIIVKTLLRIFLMALGVAALSGLVVCLAYAAGIQVGRVRQAKANVVENSDQTGFALSLVRKIISPDQWPEIHEPIKPPVVIIPPTPDKPNPVSNVPPSELLTTVPDDYVRPLP